MAKKNIIKSIILLALLSIIFIPGYLRIKKLNRQNKELERQIQEVIEVNKRLKEEQQKLVNDPVYLEKVAREKLGVAKKGEIIYKVSPPSQDKAE